MTPTLTSRTDTRDKWFLCALLAHAPLAVGLGLLLSGEGLLHILFEAILPAVLAVFAYTQFKNQRAFRVIGSVLLMLYSGVLIHLGGGLVEWHFHVFVSLALLILYYDWLPIIVAAARSRLRGRRR